VGVSRLRVNFFGINNNKNNNNNNNSKESFLKSLCKREYFRECSSEQSV